MKLTQFLTFEICTACNLGHVHKECPNADPERWRLIDATRPLTDDLIERLAAEAYNRHGFQGAIAWHYYCEPLLAKERMLALMARIKAAIPAARFCLWTNGELIPADCGWLSAFDFCWVTNYTGQDFSRVRRAIPRTKVVSWQLDKRRQAKTINSLAPCGRMFSEFIIDHFGNVHACCIDWRGEIKLGNVWDESLDVILGRWHALRDAIALGQMTDDAPATCRQCALRHANVACLVPDIAAAGSTYIRQTVKAQKAERHQRHNLLAVAAYGPGDHASWAEHATGYADHVFTCASWRDAAERIRRSQAYFGLLMTPGQRLSGPVKQALQLHPNENKLIVSCQGADGKPHGDLIIAKLSDVQHWAGLAPVFRKTVPLKPIRLTELQATSDELPPAKRLAVTFTHYAIPEARLADHFRWNDRLYRQHGARVFVITDKQYEVPDYARCLIYPEAMPIFNLSKTSNYGIRYAIDAGFDIVIKTDADMAFPDDAFASLADPSQGLALVPVYHMADNYDDRASRYVLAPGATGTIGMVADDWLAAHFHEGCQGYGCDDGILMKEIARNKIKTDRSSIVYHIAHVAGTPQQEFNKRTPRVDHWNRDTGFNPENFSGNRPLHNRRDTSATWGLPGFAGLTVVATHYAMPESRLLEFVEWNGALFEANGIRCIIVSDQERYGLPPVFRVARYPLRLDMFNLAKCSNWGIRLAGLGVICKSDVDCSFSQEAIDAMKQVTAARGISPRYYMAASYVARHQAPSTWDASKGTICLHWDHWQALKGYNERLQGYGIEDGECFERARRLPGRTVDRVQLPFWHIAHSTGRQQTGNMRRDCWNRDTGFNPRNHSANAAALREGVWDCDAWGITCQD